MLRNYQYPPQVDAQFTYGLETVTSENAKLLISPPEGIIDEPDEVKNLYYRSHGVTDAGQQMARDYQWPVNKDKFRFG